MEILLSHQGKYFTANLAKPLDISIPLAAGYPQVNCFHAPAFETEPVRAGNFVGSTQLGGSVNFLNLRINPHGNGTHTECVGHIAREEVSINQTLTQFHCLAHLISLQPEEAENGDKVIGKKQLMEVFPEKGVPALIIRSLPNPATKKYHNYSGTNPPYMAPSAVEFLVDRGVQHLLLDLPSLDREEDEGRLLSHKTFWQYPSAKAPARRHCTITELIYVPEEIVDGMYLLNLQIASLETDASPSKPVLYMLKKQNSK